MPTVPCTDEQGATVSRGSRRTQERNVSGVPQAGGSGSRDPSRDNCAIAFRYAHTKHQADDARASRRSTQKTSGEPCRADDLYGVPHARRGAKVACRSCESCGWYVHGVPYDVIILCACGWRNTNGRRKANDARACDKRCRETSGGSCWTHHLSCLPRAGCRRQTARRSRQSHRRYVQSVSSESVAEKPITLSSASRNVVGRGFFLADSRWLIADSQSPSAICHPPLAIGYLLRVLTARRVSI